MSILLMITGLRAAETLAKFHRHRVENSVGEVRAYHQDIARRCEDDAELITREIEAAGLDVANQASAVRCRDLATAQRIIERHVIMHGMGMSVEDVGAARGAMARDISDALAAERGGTGSR
jgi:hypothetical protein